MIIEECPICGALELIKETRVKEFEYKDVPFTIGISTTYCNSCHEGFLSVEECKVVEEHLSLKKAEIDNR